MQQVYQRIEQKIATGAIQFVDKAPINDVGMDYLANHQNISNVTKIILRTAFTGSYALKNLHQPNLQNLLILQLKNCQIDNLGCKYISRCSFKFLQKLSFASNQIDKYGVMHLSKGQWKQMRTLSLYSNKIEGFGIKFICKINCTDLQILCFTYNDAKVQDFTQLMGLNASLKHLYISISDSNFEKTTTFTEAILQKFNLLKKFDY